MWHIMYDMTCYMTHDLCHNMPWHDTQDMIYYDMTWYPGHDIIWYNDMKYDMTWYDISYMTHCTKYGMIQDNITWHMPCQLWWHDLIWHKVAWNKWNDMKLHVRVLCFVHTLSPALSHQWQKWPLHLMKEWPVCMLWNIQPCLASSGGSES